MDKKEVVVVVPVYRPELTVWERASLRQTVRVLQENYPVELLVPCGMDCSAIRREVSGLPVREVSDEWLGRRNGIAGYNRMMLSAGFYELFRDYEYLLIPTPGFSGTNSPTGAVGDTTVWPLPGSAAKCMICRF